MSNRRTQNHRSFFHLEKQSSCKADLIRNLCLQILNLCLQRHVLIVQGLTETGKRVGWRPVSIWNVHRHVLFPTVWCTLSSAVGHNERPTTNSCWLMNQCNVSIRRSCRWCSAYTCMLVSLVAPLLLSAFRESSRLFLCNSFSASLDRPGKSWENTQISTENYISK